MEGAAPESETGTAAMPQVSYTDLEEKLARAQRERDEALEQQWATAEVLRVISSSPGDLQPVFNAMLANATRLCEASYGLMLLCERDAFRSAAVHGPLPPAFIEQWRTGTLFRPDPDIPAFRAAQTRQIVQVPDLRATPAYLRGDPFPVSGADVAGIRTMVAVPMLKEDQPIGVMAIYRQEVRPFTDKQIELVQNFANQAVIAIENTRLLNELQQRTADLTESLQQQTATSEVLGVISSSPGDLQSVFQAMLANAVRICGAKFGNLWLREGDSFRISATYGAPSAFEAYLRRERPVLDVRDHSHIPIARTARTKEILNVRDLVADPSYIERDSRIVALVELAGARSLLVVPMLKDTELIGAIVIYRQEVGSFTDRRLSWSRVSPTRPSSRSRTRGCSTSCAKSLQQQTATADVLKVISRSTFDLQTVLETLTASAAHLCEADMAATARQKGDAHYLVSVYGYPPNVIEYVKTIPHERGTGSVVGRTVLSAKTVHVTDVLADPEYTNLEMQKTLGYRTVLGVPLLREGNPIGVISLVRKSVRPFTDKQIELVTTFADQAVIAIENVRLFEAEQQRTRELAEALEQQKATSDVLQVISSSPGELEPVFQAMLANAVRICEGKFGIMYRFADGAFRALSSLGAPAINQEPHVVSEHPHNPLTRVAGTKAVVHIPDLTLDQAYIERNPRIVALVETGGARNLLVVPMLQDDELIGAITIYRLEARPFTDKQIELVQNFAAQAVIAIENTRLLNELRGIPAAANRHGRCAQGHQPLDLRSADGSRHSGPVGGPAVRNRMRFHPPSRGRSLSLGRQPWFF